VLFARPYIEIYSLSIARSLLSSVFRRASKHCLVSCSISEVNLSDNVNISWLDTSPTKSCSMHPTETKSPPTISVFSSSMMMMMFCCAPVSLLFLGSTNWRRNHLVLPSLRISGSRSTARPIVFHSPRVVVDDNPVVL